MYLAGPKLIGKSAFSRAQAGSDAQEVVVDCLTLDRYARDVGLEYIAAMKIDVEGAELMVLKGAEGLLRRGRIGVIQCEPWNASRTLWDTQLST